MRPSYPHPVWVVVLGIALAVAVVATLEAFLFGNWFVALAGLVVACLAAACIRHEQGKL